MENTTKLAFLAILECGLATATVKANFSLSLPLFLAISLLFIERSSKFWSAPNQISLKFVIKRGPISQITHAIFLNHKNSNI
jgi:hypothetical protein